jgi:hypothetical protein
MDGETTEGQMNNLKRFTVCKLRGHDWAKVPYPRTADGDDSGTFMKCLRCRKENHNYGTVARGAGPLY